MTLLHALMCPVRSAYSSIRLGQQLQAHLDVTALSAESTLAATGRSFFQAQLFLQLDNPGRDLPLPEHWKARAVQVGHLAVALLR